MSDEISIPTPINRPKEQPTMKAGHPSRITTEAKPAPANLAKALAQHSRFEPAAVRVEVPSHGLLYRGKVNDAEVAKGFINVKPLTLTEEKIITTDRLVQQGKALDMVLENCITSDVDPYELLSADRLYILFFLRGMSYGLSYDFAVKCYLCGQNFDQTVDIDKLTIDEWDETSNFQEPIIVQLPYSKATVEAHFMRGHDERALTEKARELKSLDSIDDAVGNSLTMLIDKITLASGEVLSPIDRKDFIDHMVAGDADSFRDTLNDRDCGLKPLERITCPRCEGTLSFNVPLGRNFFRRPRPRAEPKKI